MSDILQTAAWGLVRGSDGLLINGRGATISKVGTGIYQIVLSDNFLLDDEEMMITITNQGTATKITSTSEGTDSVKVVRTSDSDGVPADSNFYFKIERLKIL